MSLEVLGRNDLQAGRAEDAVARYKEFYAELLVDDDPAIDGTNFGAAVDIFPFLVAADDRERADLLLKKSLVFMQTQPRFGTTGYLWYDVEALAYQGKHAAALTALREAVDAGLRVMWWYYFDLHPALEPLRNKPEFIALREELAADMAQQLANVRAHKAEQGDE